LEEGKKTLVEQDLTISNNVEELSIDKLKPFYCLDYTNWASRGDIFWYQIKK